MDLRRRIQLYLIGLVIGGALAYLFYGDRLTNAGWTPKERIKLRLGTTLVKASPVAASYLRDHGMPLDSVRLAMREAEVRLKDTRRSGDSLFYEVRVPLQGRPTSMTILVFEDHRRDSTATLWSVEGR
ncbi:MAG: hypothetical protein KDB88_07095 [Flavobacteriales bacterium]|nr:hypothetical protein [Flavobacteriales bacterium]MCB0794488.1 hypothetical protein [Flavobacteriales bacterium]